LGFLSALMMMLLISVSFISIGLIFASLMEDMQGFQLIMNFLIMPVFLLSGALFPLTSAPDWLHALSLANPLTYGVDGLRLSLIGFSQFPLWLDASVLAVFGLVMITIGAYLFGKTQV